MLNSNEPYVLIADDDPDALALLTTIVRATGLPFDTATSGKEALARIHRSKPGFVVLDLTMPDVDGFGVLSRLMLDPAMHDLPVLLLTGRDLTEEEIGKLGQMVLSVMLKGNINPDAIQTLIKESFLTDTGPY